VCEWLAKKQVFLSFPYVCPEPVLVKYVIFTHKWLKKPVFSPGRRERPKIFLDKRGVATWLYNGVGLDTGNRPFTMATPILDDVPRPSADESPSPTRSSGSSMPEVGE
jgi:hypothetical protein